MDTIINAEKVVSREVSYIKCHKCGGQVKVFVPIDEVVNNQHSCAIITNVTFAKCDGCKTEYRSFINPKTTALSYGWTPVVSAEDTKKAAAGYTAAPVASIGSTN